MATQAEGNNKYIFSSKEVVPFLELNYGLKALKCMPVKAGIINTSVKVVTQQGNYLLRIYPKGKNPTRVLRELAFSQNIAKYGVPVATVTPGINRKNTQKISTRDGGSYLAVLFQFLNGQHTTHNQEGLIPAIASIHAIMHKIGLKSIPSNTSKTIRPFIKWLGDERTVAKKSLANHREILKSLDTIYHSLHQEYIQQRIAISKLPFALCHLDYDSNNILNDNKKITGVIDFDDLAPAPPILDIGFSLWWWCYFNPLHRRNIIDKYISSYSRVRRMTKNEQSFLRLFMRIRNLVLAYLLFANLPKKPDVASLRKAIAFDQWLSDNAI